MTLATAYWTLPPEGGELRTESLPEPGAEEAVVRTLHSGISRGTELLVHRGLVPPSVAEEMRAPFQVGDFAGPLKYGYLSVGVVEAGPSNLVGRSVFCLYPHQDRYVVPVSALTVLPADVPPHRAILAGAVETAINALWDAGPRLGDRVAVVGGGLIGGALLGLLRTLPLDRLELIDTNPDRAALARGLGVDFASPEEARGDCDLVFHASASAGGLSGALELAGTEAEVIELSWYGAQETPVALGAAFHARRLTLRASQVSAISPARRARRTHADRLALALDALHDDAFEILISGSSPFTDLPATMQRLASGELNAICHRINY